MEFKVDYDVSYEPLLQFFTYGHLREDLKSVSAQFADMAQYIVAELPRNPERAVALRKLLEAKDAGVRAMLYTDGMGSRPGEKK